MTGRVVAENVLLYYTENDLDKHLNRLNDADSLAFLQLLLETAQTLCDEAFARYQRQLNFYVERSRDDDMLTKSIRFTFDDGDVYEMPYSEYLRRLFDIQQAAKADYEDLRRSMDYKRATIRQRMVLYENLAMQQSTHSEGVMHDKKGKVLYKWSVQGNTLVYSGRRKYLACALETLYPILAERYRPTLTHIVESLVAENIIRLETITPSSLVVAWYEMQRNGTSAINDFCHNDLVEALKTLVCG